MQLHTGFSPNGMRVEIFLKEKDLKLPIRSVDVMGGETQSDQFLQINGLGEVPVLELDDGSYLTESIAICRYLEALHPDPNLFGGDPLEQARVEMWNRRMELKLFNTIGDAGLHELEFFKNRIMQFPEYAAARRREFANRLSWLNSDLSDGRSFIAGDRFTVADITGMAMLIICGFIKAELPAQLEYVHSWADSVKNRASWPEM